MAGAGSDLLEEYLSDAELEEPVVRVVEHELAWGAETGVEPVDPVVRW